jgi:hypothetical protein
VVLQPDVQWLGQLAKATDGKSTSGGALNGVQKLLRAQKTHLSSSQKSASRRIYDPFGF